MLRSASGVWGPAAFAIAALVAARRQPGYDHRRHHVSGLAARRTGSGPVMVLGFLALGAASLVMPSPDPTLRRLLRVAGVGTVAAGLFRCSSVDCPDPLSDPEATWEDGAHSVASVATFVVWTALPVVAARHAPRGADRTAHLGLGGAAAAGLVVAGLTTRRDSARKGLAQRGFLATVFAWFVLTAWRGSGSARRGGAS